VRALPASFVVIATCLAAVAPCLQAEELAEDLKLAQPSATAPPPAAGVSVSASPGASGFRVHIDPQTGRLLREPAPGSAPLQLSPREQNALSTSHQGLTEVTSTVPGGGVKIDLQGRFRSPLIATIDAKGKVRTQHVDEAHGFQPKK
jgi:hypothetical protein